MGDSVEVVNVLTCLDTILSTYRDGYAIVEKLQSQRAEKPDESSPPHILEQTVLNAPDEIEKEKERGCRRFGKRFEDGDHTAVIALQQITIQLQSTLLNKLEAAASDTAEVNIPELVDIAELNRDRIIGIILELKQRLLDARPLRTEDRDELAPIPKRTSRSTKKDEGRASVSVHPVSSQSRPNLSTRPKRASTFAGLPRYEEDSGEGNEQNGAFGQRVRHGSVLGFLRHVRDRSSSRKSAHEDLDESTQSGITMPFRTTKQCDVRRDAASPVRANGDGDQRFTFEEGNDFWDQGRAFYDYSHRESLGSSQMSPERSSSPTSSGRNNSVITLPKPNMMTTAFTSAATAIGSPSSIRNPTPENHYLGFCKAAWRLQNGDRRAMQKSKEFNDGWQQSDVYCLTCTGGRCAFAGHVPLDIIWTKVWTNEDLAIKVRWAFLAKSHVQQHRIKDKKFLYQCMFCAFQGLGSRRLHGTDAYLEHISNEHRGRPLNEAVLQKTGAVVDHVCDDSEEFDINLFPLTNAEQASMDLRMREEQLAAKETLRSSTEKQDSMFSEPWNEGLSEFHYGGEMDATEKAC